MRPEDNDKYQILTYEGYSFYKFPVNDETIEMANYLRGLHKKRLHKAGYDGYSEEIDNEFHEHGVYFYAVCENVVATTMRINDRVKSKRFPFEIGQKKNGTKYKYTNDVIAVDMNTYCLDKRYYKKATPILFAMAGKYIKQHGAKRAYGLADIKNKAILRIYSELDMANSKEYSEPILFETFIHKQCGNPVEWCILEWSEEVINKYSEKFDIMSLANS